MLWPMNSSTRWCASRPFWMATPGQARWPSPDFQGARKEGGGGVLCCGRFRRCAPGRATTLGPALPTATWPRLSCATRFAPARARTRLGIPEAPAQRRRGLCHGQVQGQRRRLCRSRSERPTPPHIFLAVLEEPLRSCAVSPRPPSFPASAASLRSWLPVPGTGPAFNFKGFVFRVRAGDAEAAARLHALASAQGLRLDLPSL